MVRNAVIAVVVCLYVAGSIWIVGHQGQSYRDGLTNRKSAVKEVAAASPAATPENDRAVPIVAAAEASTTTPEPAGSRPAPAPAREPTPNPIAVDKPSLAPVPESAKATASAPALPKSAPPTPAGNAVRANPLEKDPFWSRPQLTRVWDLSHLTPRDESDLGAQFHDAILQLTPFVKEGPWLRRVEEAAERLIKFVDRKDINYKYFILDSDDVNAFSTPDGYIYISRGLFDLIGENEDYALEFVIGHEIGHVDRQHAIQCLRDPGVTKMPLGTLQKLYWLILPAGYLSSNTVDQEFQADEWVANKMQRLQRTRREILIFLNKLEGYAEAHGFRNGRAEPRPNHDVSMLDNHYRAQTAAWKRLKHLKAFMDQAAGAPK
jgi:hypothetical protein